MPGMHVTPERYGQAQSPLAASTCARSLHAEFIAIASNSFDRVRLDFSPLSRCPIASLSPRGSRPKYRPLTCFLFAPSCEVDGITEVRMLPLSHSGRVRAPWSPTPAPGSCSYRRVGCDFPQPSLPPIDRFTLRIPSTIPGHSLAFDSQRCVKPAASSGLDATPESFRPNQSPLVAVLLRQVPPSIVITRYRGDF
jgi:hypothetical protein